MPLLCCSLLDPSHLSLTASLSQLPPILISTDFLSAQERKKERKKEEREGNQRKTKHSHPPTHPPTHTHTHVALLVDPKLLTPSPDPRAACYVSIGKNVSCEAKSRSPNVIVGGYRSAVPQWPLNFAPYTAPEYDDAHWQVSGASERAAAATEAETETETETETERQRQQRRGRRQRQRGGDRETETERPRQRQRQKDRNRDRAVETHTHTHTQHSAALHTQPTCPRHPVPLLLLPAPPVSAGGRAARRGHQPDLLRGLRLPP